MRTRLWWLKVGLLKLAADWYADYREELGDEELVKFQTYVSNLSRNRCISHDC